MTNNNTIRDNKVQVSKVQPNSPSSHNGNLLLSYEHLSPTLLDDNNQYDKNRTNKEDHVVITKVYDIDYQHAQNQSHASSSSRRKTEIVLGITGFFIIVLEQLLINIQHLIHI